MRVMLNTLVRPVALATIAGWLTISPRAAMADEPKVPARTELAQREQHLRLYLATHEDAVDARYLLAYTLFRENRATESLAEYTRAAALRRPTAKDLEIVALDYVLLNDYSDADTWMSRSVREQPEAVDGWYELGRIKYTENRFTDALNCFQKALAIEPRSVKAENNLGLTLEGLNRTDEAIAAYRKALAWQQDAVQQSEQPMLNLSIVLTDRQQLQEALSLAQAAERISPQDPKISEQLGRIYLQTGELEKSEAALARASVLSPANAAIHFELARVYRREGKADLAKKESEKVALLSGSTSTSPR